MSYTIVQLHFQYCPHAVAMRHENAKMRVRESVSATNLSVKFRIKEVVVRVDFAEWMEC